MGCEDDCLELDGEINVEESKAYSDTTTNTNDRLLVDLCKTEGIVVQYRRSGEDRIIGVSQWKM